jgi:4-hydroxybenzoate polyprenyltransferase
MYTADHLLDALKRKKEISIRRHLFHYKHYKIILLFGVLATITCIYLASIKLSSEIVFMGILIGIGILMYFGAIYFSKHNKPVFLQKELTIALIYVGGIWMAPIVWYGKNPDGIIWIVIANLALLAWAEGIIVSWHEFHKDTADKHISFTILYGKKRSRKFIYFLLLVVFAFSLTGFLINYNSITFQFAFGIQMLMSIILFMLILFPSHFDKNELYRYIGEAVFMFQGLMLLI